MIFLADNAFLERDLTFDDIKPRSVDVYQDKVALD